MMRKSQGLIVAVLAVIALMLTPGTANAETCVEHLLKAGTTKDADIAYHYVHGGESPCKQQESSNSSTNTSRERRHRDSPGFHCTWHGCG